MIDIAKRLNTYIESHDTDPQKSATASKNWNSFYAHCR